MGGPVGPGPPQPHFGCQIHDFGGIFPCQNLAKHLARQFARGNDYLTEFSIFSFFQFFVIFQNRSEMIPNDVFRLPESEFAVESRFRTNFYLKKSKLLFAVRLPFAGRFLTRLA